jgi:hypothetical protein
MFKGLHHTAYKAKPAISLKNQSVFPIYSAEDLLGSQARQKDIENIKSVLNLPGKLFDSLYYQLIKNFAELTQNLPQTHYGIFSHSGGFLDHGIQRALRSLSLCLHYFFPQEKTLQMANQQEALWIYAVFSASLLLDVGKLAVKYQISLCEKDGTKIRDWQPYFGPMTKQNAKFYQFDFVKENRDHLGWLVTSLLARQLMIDVDDSNSKTPNGFNWIASNPIVLEAWLRMLNNDSRGVGSYLTVIPIADAQIIEAYLNSQKIGTGSGGQPTGLFTTEHLNTSEAFLQWLREALANGTLALNGEGALVHQTNDGILISSELFKQFVDSNSRYSNPEGVEQQFKQMMETYISAPDMTRYAGLKGLSSQTHMRFLLINNPALLVSMGGPLDAITAALTTQAGQKPLFAKHFVK